MRMISIAFADETTLSFARSDDPFVSMLRLAAAVFWYDPGQIPQDQGAEIGGLARAVFIDALGRANIIAIQTTVGEIKAELVRPLHACRLPIGADSDPYDRASGEPHRCGFSALLSAWTH